MNESPAVEGSRDFYYHPDLRKSEEQLLLGRRHKAGVKTGDPQVGVALSGGGIRSATFCLGVFQSLARYNFLPKVDFLSTVSGGGYFGGFLGRLFDIQGAGKNPSAQDEVRKILTNPLSSPLKWLREHGRYLSPHGPFDGLGAVFVYLRNWAAVQTVILTFGLWLVYCVQLVAALVQMGTDCLPFGVPFSSLFAPTAFFFLFCFFPLGLGYWLCQGEGEKAVPVAPMATLLVLGSSGLLLVFLCHLDNWIRISACIISGITWIAVFALVVLWSVACLGKMGVETAEFLRTRFTSSFIKASWLLGFFLFLSLVDTVGNQVYSWLWSHMKLGAFDSSALLASTAAFLVGIGKKISSLFSETSKIVPKLPMVLISGLAALAWILAILAVLSGISEILAWGLPGPVNPETDKVLLADWPRLLWVLLGLTLLCVGLGKTISFLNFSSNHPFYKYRLANAYLGAANTLEGKAEEKGKGGGNDVWMKNYRPYLEGGPLHLVNVTINETVDGKSQVEERDRKGVPMAIGPAGLSVGRRHHCVWEDVGGRKDFSRLRPLLYDKDTFHVFENEDPGFLRGFFGRASSRTRPPSHFRPVEYLSLGSWVAISGAAFSTGLGAKTNIALSSLLGLANVRLGYWWNSHVSSTEQGKRKKLPLVKKISLNMSKWLPVQFGLLDELTARFHGTARPRWYLSDGGHFENTACYELIRRRVPFIVLCDDGQDVDYGFEDLAGLVLKARNDFQAEITFFGPNDIKKSVHKDLQPFIGSLQDFKVKGSQKHALLGWVQYPPKRGKEGDHSLLLVLKPSLSGDEPLDLLEYGHEQKDFPQETTMNQFFTEAQWEAYRKLGEHITGKIFSISKPGKGWTPAKGNSISRPTGV